MRMIIHDLPQQMFDSIGMKTAGDTVISDNGSIKSCIGCFGCWIKTPGVCVLKDEYRHMGELLAACHELLVISQCFYGSYSPFVRNVWDRSIPYLLPYFTTKNSETHHTPRYQNRLTYAAYFYGEAITEAEMQTAKELVRANAANFYTDVTHISFHRSISAMKEALVQ